MIPQTLGDTASLDSLSPQIKTQIENIDYFIVENEKAARRFIKRICPNKIQSELKLQSLNKFTEASEITQMLNPCLEGHNIGMISDAGCPGVADPGAEIAALAHEKNIQVIPLVGPSSILLSLMASGMNGQSFAFHGYLTIDKNERKRELKRLERESEQRDQTQIFIETPYRNNELLKGLIQTLHPNTRLCIACDLTLDTEYIKTLPIKDWNKEKVDLHKRPCIFLFHKS